MPWPCNKTKYISHFPETREIWSYGSGYGGNALLGKKCHALRIASVKARDEGWMAEHMLILKLTNPEGKSKFIAAASLRACGKTNLAMLMPTIPGWKAETIGDDICWMKFGDDGRLYAINPETGFFGVAPGTSDESNFNAMKTLDRQLHLLQRRADRRRRRVVGADEQDARAHRRLDAPRLDAACPGARRPPQCALHGAGQPVPGDRAGMGRPQGRADRRHPVRRPPRHRGAARHRSAQLAARHVPRLDHGLGEDGGRRRQVGDLRRDPMAMLPFCGYHMGDYFAHWLKMGEKGGAKMPKIFYVNWFRKNGDGKFMWPGYGETAAC